MRIRRLQNVSRAHDDLRLLDKLKTVDSNLYIVLDLEKDKDYHVMLKQVCGSLDIRHIDVIQFC